LAGKYCTRCGYSNAPTRGACLMCFGYLDVEGRGVICPNPECGLENGKEATFCKYCGTALAEEAVAIPGIVEAALSISNAMTGVTSDEFAEQEEMSEEDAAAFAEFQREQAELRGETGDEAPAAEEAVADEVGFEDEEEELLERPSALDLEQQVEEELTPPPPAEDEALSFDEEEGEAEEALSFDEEPVAAEPQPAPAPVEAEEELVFGEEEKAAPAPAAAVEPVAAGPQPAAAPLPVGELSEDDLIPPVPDNLPGFDDEVVTASVASAPVAAPAAASAPQPEAPEAETAADEIAELSEADLSLDDEEVTPAAPAEEAAEAAAEGDEEASKEGELGDWALDFEDES